MSYASLSYRDNLAEGYRVPVYAGGRVRARARAGIRLIYHWQKPRALNAEPTVILNVNDGTFPDHVVSFVRTELSQAVAMPGEALTHVVLYTDGACSPNPGFGGWAVILIYQRRLEPVERTLSGGAIHTTNNRMEMLAAISGLEALKWLCDVTLFTDSRYLRDGITRYVRRWVVNRWVTRSGTKVKNRDLWERLVKLDATHRVTWRWVRGHNGDEYNERVDRMAVAARVEARYLYELGRRTNGDSGKGRTTAGPEACGGSGREASRDRGLPAADVQAGTGTDYRGIAATA